MQLQDKVAIVTGAGSGIGRATALLFANEGAQVVAADIIGERAEETRSLAGETSTRITPSRTDVSKSADVERMVNKTLEDYGRTDILVSNAGMMIKKPAEEMTEDEWDRLMGVNLKGVWLCGQVCYSAHEGGRLRGHRQYRLNRRTARLKDERRLFRVKGRGNPADEIAGNHLGISRHPS